MKKYLNVTVFTLLFFATIFAANVLLIDKYDVWRDESFSINVAKQSISDIGSTVARDVHPPLHLYLLHYWMYYFSDSVFSVRFLSLLIAMAIPFFGYLLSKEIFTDKKDAKLYRTLAAVFILSSPFFLLQALEARAYSMLMLAEIGAIYTLIKSLESKKITKFDIGFIFFASLGLYSHVIFLFSLFALFIWHVVLLLMRVQSKEVAQSELISYVKKYAVVYTTVALIFIPWVTQLVKQILQVNTQGFWLQFNPIPDLVNSFQLFFATPNSNSELHFFSPIAKYFVSIFGPVFLFIGSFRRNQKHYLGLLITFTLGLVWIASFKNPIFYIRYIAFLVPILMIIVLEAIYSLRNIISNKISKVIIAFFIVCNLYLFYGNIYQDVNLKGNYTGAISYIVSNGPKIPIIHRHGYTLHSFTYYGPKMGIDPGKLYDPTRTNPHFEGLAAFNDSNYYDAEFPGEITQLWNPYYWEDESFNALLRENQFEVTTEQEFAGGLHLRLWSRN